MFSRKPLKKAVKGNRSFTFGSKQLPMADKAANGDRLAQNGISANGGLQLTLEREEEFLLKD